VGTDTSPVDGTASGKGIYLFEMGSDTGELTPVKLAAETANPTWLTIHPSRQYLYASNEVSNLKGGNGSVSAFTIDRSNGELRFLNSVSSGRKSGLSQPRRFRQVRIRRQLIRREY
jgi:6-phosphogluconolactonase